MLLIYERMFERQMFDLQKTRRELTNKRNLAL